MTSKCPLNRPKCKRDVMTKRGPFKDERCPWSQKKKCVFSVSACPMVSDGQEPCMLNKINSLVLSGGCGAGAGCRQAPSRRKTERYRQPCEKEAPPCVRCSQGARNRPNKVTESVQLKEEPKELKEKSKSKKDPVQPGSESSRELRSKINDKLDDLKTRQHLTQPPCSTASRRPLPCCACMLDILGPPANKGTVCTSPKAYAGLQKPPCPFMRIIDTCPKSCRCENVPPVDTGPPCPFLPLKCPCCTEPQCPLNRIANCPLIQNPPLPTPQEGGQCSCCCPVVPGNCSFTLPVCGQHNTTGLLGNRFLPVSGLVPRDPTTGSPRLDINSQEPPPLPSVTPGGLATCMCTQNALSSLRLQGFNPVWQQPENTSQISVQKPAMKSTPKQEDLKETSVKKRRRDLPDNTAKSINPGDLNDPSSEIKIKGGATLIKEGDGFKVFQKGNKKILVNYKEKNCWLIGCSCGSKGTPGPKEAEESCGCNDWVSSSMKKKKDSDHIKTKTQERITDTAKSIKIPLSDADKIAGPILTTDASKSADPSQPPLNASKPADQQQPPSNEPKPPGECVCVQTRHCGMDQFKQRLQTTTLNTNQAQPALSTKTDAPLSSVPPSVVPSVFSMPPPSYDSSY